MHSLQSSQSATREDSFSCLLCAHATCYLRNIDQIYYGVNSVILYKLRYDSIHVTTPISPVFHTAATVDIFSRKRVSTTLSRQLLFGEKFVLQGVNPIKQILASITSKISQWGKNRKIKTINKTYIHFSLNYIKIVTSKFGVLMLTKLMLIELTNRGLAIGDDSNRPF